MLRQEKSKIGGQRGQLGSSFGVRPSPGHGIHRNGRLLPNEIGSDSDHL